MRIVNPKERPIRSRSFSKQRVARIDDVTGQPWSTIGSISNFIGPNELEIDLDRLPLWESHVDLRDHI